MNRKKFPICILIAFILFLAAAYMYANSSHNSSYPMVISYIQATDNSYYDFYDIDSYLTGEEKKTLSDINFLEVYFRGKQKEYHSITIEKEKFEITYAKDIIEYSNDILRYSHLIEAKYPIYIQSSESFISVEHYLDNGVCLSVRVHQTNNTFDVLSLQNTLIKLLEDSIDLNKQTH